MPQPVLMRPCFHRMLAASRRQSFSHESVKMLSEPSKEREAGATKENQKAQHRAFPRGPPPQYYPGSNLLNFAVRMGSGEPG